MTCVLSSSWQPFSSSNEWLSMNSAETFQSPTGLENHQQGHQLTDAEARHGSSSLVKNRMSRAGTRTVTALSAAQLDRKRANDREAQRAIRQRTKDHVERLEKSIKDLQSAHDASEKLIASIQQRNRELEDENAYLRTKVSETGYSIGISRMEHQRPPELPTLGMHPIASATQPTEASIQPPNSASTSRSAMSLTAQSSKARHDSFQVGPWSTAAPNSAQVSSNPANWRPHEGSQRVHSTSGVVQEMPRNQPPAPYSAASLNERPQWAGASQAHYPSHSTAQPPAFHGPLPPGQQPTYPMAPPVAQQVLYHQPPAPRPPDLPVAVSNPIPYPEPPPAQPTHYQVHAAPPSALEGASYGPPPPQMAPSLVSTPAYHPSQGPQQYGEPSGHQAYSMPHYASG